MGVCSAHKEELARLAEKTNAMKSGKKKAKLEESFGEKIHALKPFRRQCKAGR